jgi:hypothetical protein
MRPLYDAWIEDLGDGDFLHVLCVACGHDELIPPVGLLVGWRLTPYMRVLELERRFRCREVISAARWCCPSGGQTDDGQEVFCVKFKATAR